MVMLSIYKETIEPFDKETALRFVYRHRNIFNEKTIRKVILATDKLILVKEISYFESIKNVWIWGFTKNFRFILDDVNGLTNKEIIKKVYTIFENELKG